MKTVTIRDLRSRPRQVRDGLRREREAVLTANGSPVAVLIPVDAASVEQIARIRTSLGLDRPIPVQFGRYLAGLLRGDFGPSFKYRDYTVGELIAGGLPVSLTLGAAAMAPETSNHISAKPPQPKMKGVCG